MNDIINQLNDFGSSILGQIESLTADTTLTLLVAVIAFLSACVIFPVAMLASADVKLDRKRKAELATIIPANLMTGERA